MPKIWIAQLYGRLLYRLFCFMFYLHFLLFLHWKHKTDIYFGNNKAHPYKRSSCLTDIFHVKSLFSDNFTILEVCLFAWSPKHDLSGHPIRAVSPPLWKFLDPPWTKSSFHLFSFVFLCVAVTLDITGRT